MTCLHDLLVSFIDFLVKNGSAAQSSGDAVVAFRGILIKVLVVTTKSKSASAVTKAVQIQDLSLRMQTVPMPN